MTFNHHTANRNFNGSTYEPGAYGFNVADVGSNAEVAALPTGAMRCFPEAENSHLALQSGIPLVRRPLAIIATPSLIGEQ